MTKIFDTLFYVERLVVNMFNVENVLTSPVVCNETEVDEVSSLVIEFLADFFSADIFDSWVECSLDGNYEISWRFRPDAKPADVLRVELALAESVEWSAVGFWS